MSEKNRSLASYFDYPGDTSQNWHDQTEMLQDFPAAARTVHQPEEGLGKWMFYPGHQDMLWVPQNKRAQDIRNEPPGTTFHYKTDKTWRSTDWGYDEYMQKQAQSNTPKSEKPKVHKEKMSPEARKAWKADMAKARQETRAARSKDVKALHDRAYQILQENQAWDEHLFAILESITATLSQAKAQSKAKIDTLKATGIKGLAKTQALHAETSTYIHDATWAEKLDLIDVFCSHYGLFNTLGTTLPPVNQDGTRYLSVEIMFLSKAKQVIMSGILHNIARMAKLGLADASRCDFVNTSYEANDILSKMRGKDKYIRKPNPNLADSQAIVQCKTMIMGLEKERWQKLHTGKEVPKHLKWAQPGGNHKKKKEHEKGAGHSHNKEKEKEEFELFKKFLKLTRPGNHNNHHHGKPHPAQEPPKQSNPPPARRGRGRTVPPSPSRPQAYMHGYYY